jgi:glyoxylase-like metal-dependent hydrolase (beta-lactamase superfamily II)
LYIDTGKNRVLVDTGAGKLFPTTGRLPGALKEEGIETADIDTLIITHAHGDHAGGLLDDDGAPAFPNARIYTWKREWDFWLTEDALARFPHREGIYRIRRTIERIADHVSYIEPDCEVVPCVTALAAEGHTPGHIAVSVASSGQKLMYISDTVFHPLHLEHPDWLPQPIFMLEPEQYLRSRRLVFDRAAGDFALVLAMHFAPFPCLGHVVKRAEGWEWQPIETTGDVGP